MKKEIYIQNDETGRVGTAGGLDIELLSDSLKVLAASKFQKDSPPVGIRVSFADGDRNANVPPGAVYRINFFTRFKVGEGTIDKYARGEIYLDAKGAIVRGADPTDDASERRIHF